MLINARVQKLVGGTFVERLGINLVSLTEMARLLFHKNPAKLRLIRSTRIGRRSMVTADELFILHSLTESMRERSGDGEIRGYCRGGRVPRKHCEGHM